jgi:molecular chaperone DnaJ
MRSVAAVKRDYYEVLGVPKDADESAIRRAFHAKARQWHPDVAAAPDAEGRFRELAEAYSVLSKREARLLYDRYEYRGRGNQRFDERSDPGPSGDRRGEDVHLDIKLRDFEAVAGTRYRVEYQARVRCVRCNGHGSLAVPDPACAFCKGTGHKRTVAHLDVAHLLHMEACPSCIFEPCPRCGRAGTVTAEQRIRLLVPPGVEDGAYLRARGDGHDAGARTIPGDLLVRVHVLPPPKDPHQVRYVAFALLLVAIATLVLYVFY